MKSVRSQIASLEKKIAGHVTESDDFNEKHPKIIQLCQKQDKLRHQVTLETIKLTEGLKELIKLSDAIKPEDFPDQHPRSSTSKDGYTSSLKLNLERYEQSLELLMHYSAS